VHTSKVLKLLEDSNILYVTVPGNCTDRLQPLDLSVNKPAKSTMKPVAAQWMKEPHSYIASQPSIVINGFRAAGIKDCLEQL